MRRIGALLSTAFLLAFVVGISPHLVHHAFEHERAADDCPFAASTERAPAAAASPAFLVAPLPQRAGPTMAGHVTLPRPERAADAARAPPVTAS
jgi:hypothetical protein